MLRLRGDERGAVAVLVAAALLLLLGFAALAIDLGAGFNERRADQSAADFGALAGSVEALRGGQAVRDQALELTRSNLPATYTDAEWQALWEGCRDPEAVRNQGGFDFVAVPPPAGWAPVDPANWCISVEAARGLLRVRVPQQRVGTSFGALFGIDELRTGAAAVSRIANRGPGGILPFGVPLGSGDGGHLCLSSGPSGQAIDPCSGPAAGNFGTLKGRLFGNREIPTVQNCTASPVGNVLAQNIAHGYDHIVVPDRDASVANEVRDECVNPFVDTLNTDTGFPNSGAEEGLVGPVPGGHLPRLAQSANKSSVFGNDLDDTPLWSFLVAGPDYGASATSDTIDDAPASCDPNSFNNTLAAADWDGDGLVDTNESWQHMQACVADYTAGGFVTEIFDSSITGNPARFGYIPEFWESDLGTGNSWLHVRRFRAVYLQTLAWKKGNDWVFHSPGEACAPSPCSGNGYSVRQLSAFVIPDSALPREARGDMLPGMSGVNPYEVELYR